MPASTPARALRAYVRHVHGTLGKAQTVDGFLDEHLRVQWLWRAQQRREDVTTMDDAGADRERGRWSSTERPRGDRNVLPGRCRCGRRG